ncbi:MAG: trigger factor [Vicinamibacterales bacterium]
MKTELVDVSETRKNLVVEIPSEVVDAEITRISTRYGKSARLPGFRPGKVPARVVKQRFKSQILHDVAHALVEQSVGSALTERGVEPVDSPNIRDLKLEEGQPLTFTAEFDVVPPFDPGTFADIELTRPPVTVDEGAVSAALERLRERAARYEPVDEGVVGDGHTVVMDLSRAPIGEDGTPGEAETHSGVSVELGAASNPPGFDQELLGLAKGETKTFTLGYAADYAVPELAGTSVQYTVSVQDVRRRVLPELDDEFAKDLGEFDTLAALTARVREDLEAESREASSRQVRSDALKALAARLPYAVPPSLVDREVDRRVEEFARRLIEQRIDPRQTNIDWAAFREGQREPAVEAVASALVLDQVAAREALTVGDEEIEQELERYATQSGRTVPAIRAMLEQEGGLGRLTLGLRREKAVAHVLAHATIRDGAPGEASAT